LTRMDWNQPKYLTGDWFRTRGPLPQHRM